MSARPDRSPTAETPGSGPAPRRRAGSPIGNSGGRSIFWLSHKENEGDNKVKVSLDPRRIAAGREGRPDGHRPRLEGGGHPERPYEAKVEREKADPPVSKPEEVYNQGEEGKGAIYAIDKIGEPGNYTVTVVAKRGGQELGRDTARFLVYQDDRELENPSADLELAREIAALTEGEPVTPERLDAPTSKVSTARPTPNTSPTLNTGSGTTGPSS